MRADPWFEPGRGWRDVLYRLSLEDLELAPTVAQPDGLHVRALESRDFVNGSDSTRPASSS